MPSHMKDFDWITTQNIHIGISGIDLLFDALEFGEGIRLSKTDCALLTGYMLHFEHLTEKRKDELVYRKDEDGSRWTDITKDLTPLGGLISHPITAELYIPSSASTSIGKTSFDLARWILAMLRLRPAPSLSAPVISKQSMLDCSIAEANVLELLPFETRPRAIWIQSTLGRSVPASELEWVVNNWKRGAKLANEHKELSLAIEALDQAHFVHDPALGVLLIWAALEGLFSPSRSELRFRVSSLIASFLEPPGTQRRLLRDQVAKLYDARSAAAHERVPIERGALFQSMDLLRRITDKMISETHVPSKDELECALFGG